jgi:hypothetical protein
MATRTANYSEARMAGIAGLLFALVYVGLEFSHGVPNAIRVGGDANSISIWHFPLIWLLAAVLFHCVSYAVRTVRGAKVRERAISFSFSVVAAVLLASYWLLPMVGGLYDGLTRPAAAEEANTSVTPIKEGKRALPAKPVPPAKPAPRESRF